MKKRITSIIIGSANHPECKYKNVWVHRGDDYCEEYDPITPASMERVFRAIKG